ncbi:MAG: hypothetical protein QG603_757 [Patescibacteria group bacterium]|nr:hypothetical protein [Patescibacteria group bacterium]
MKFIKAKSASGFTLVEAIIYLAIVGIVITAAVDFAITMGNTTAKMSANIDASRNRRFALSTINYLVRNADGLLKDINGDCSNFNVNPPVLALYFDNDNYLPGICVERGGGVKITAVNNRLKMTCYPNITNNGQYNACTASAGNSFWLTGPEVRISTNLQTSCVPINIANLTSNIGTSDPQDTASVTATTGRVLYMTVGMSFGSGFPDDSLTISGLGATWTKISTNTYASRRRVWLFKGVGASGNGAVTIDYTGSGTPQEVGWVLDEATGLDLATPNDSVVTTATDGVSSVTVSTGETPGACDVTYSSLILESQIATNVEAGWSALGQTSSGSLGVRKVASAWDDGADQSHTWSWTGSEGVASFITILNGTSAQQLSGDLIFSTSTATSTANGFTSVTTYLNVSTISNDQISLRANSAATSTANMRNEQPNGLISWYKFDETDTSTAVDSVSAYNLTCTGTGGPSSGTNLIDGSTKAFDFNASEGDYCYVNNPEKFNFGNSFSISTWLKTNAPDASEHGIISKFNGASKGYYFFNNEDSGQVIFTLCNGTICSNILDAGYVLEDLTVYNIIVVYDKPADVAKMYIYEKGVGNISTTTVNSLPFLVNDSTANYPRIGDNFQGTIDELRLYNRALSNSEIWALQSQGAN